MKPKRPQPREVNEELHMKQMDDHLEFTSWTYDSPWNDVNFCVEYIDFTVATLYVAETNTVLANELK